MPWTGLEPAHLTEPPPQDGVSTNFTTRAIEKEKGQFPALFFFCDPAGTRTQGPYIKSVLLYQLSYEIILLSKAGANIHEFFKFSFFLKSFSRIDNYFLSEIVKTLPIFVLYGKENSTLLYFVLRNNWIHVRSVEHYQSPQQ